MIDVLLIIAIVLIFFVPPRGTWRRGAGINDLYRWKQYGGILERPPPPSPSRIKSCLSKMNQDAVINVYTGGDWGYTEPEAVRAVDDTLVIIDCSTQEE